MSSKVFSSSTIGLDARLIEVEVDLSPGLFSFNIVGLPDKSVEESKERIASALKNSGASPASRQNKRVTVNLAPADIHKEGSSFDLPIAMGYLHASGQIRADLDDSLFLGELALDGSIRSVNGVLSAALMAKKQGIKNIFVPKDNLKEAAMVKGINIFSPKNILELVDHLEGTKPLENLQGKVKMPQDLNDFDYDFKYIAGQEFAKRALEISAAGGHNVLLFGSPGGGKTLLARSMPSILPKLSEDEMLEVIKIYSVAGLICDRDNFSLERPFRAPHHTTSHVALVGGGTYPKPGEITLSHNGVLFLDEFPEFSRSVLESLRQPLEDGVVTIARAKGHLSFPARFVLVAAMNPCPCGNYSDEERACSCNANQVYKYQKRISGPLLDRIDLHIRVGTVKYQKLASDNLAEESEKVRGRVEGARDLQRKRFENENFSINSAMSISTIKKYCKLDRESEIFLEKAAEKLGFSARAYHRVLKVARTIADLSGSENIKIEHLAEALQYRPQT